MVWLIDKYPSYIGQLIVFTTSLFWVMLTAKFHMGFFCFVFQENSRLTKDAAELKSQLTTKTGDLLRLEELHDRVAEDKKRLSHRVNKLMANGEILCISKNCSFSFAWEKSKILMLP